MPGPVNPLAPGVLVTNMGLEIADGTTVRATLGILKPATTNPPVAAVYGLRVNGSAISGDMGGSPPALTATAGGQLTNNGVEVADGTYTRATLGNLGSSYGLRVISSNGSTVIIDGSSDIFKIAASGTLTTSSFTGPGFQTANDTLSTGLTFMPSHLSFTNFNSTVFMSPYIQHVAGMVAQDRYVSASLTGGNQTLVAAYVIADASGT